MYIRYFDEKTVKMAKKSDEFPGKNLSMERKLELEVVLFADLW